MAVRKITISLDPELADQVATGAAAEGETTSAWIADALAAKLRRKALRSYLDWYQAQHGAFTEEELKEVDLLWPA